MIEGETFQRAIERTMLTPDIADVTCAVADVLREHYGFLLFSSAMSAARAAVEAVEANPTRRRLREERDSTGPTTEVEESS